jgi:RNA polymerase sigma-70 factor, ECF subfamily
VTPKQEQFLLFRVRHFQDESAFRSLFEQYGPQIQRYLRARLPNFTEADDVFSDTWLNLWNYAQSTNIESFVAVAITIARNQVAGFYKKQSKRAETFLEDEVKGIHSVPLHEKTFDSIDVDLLMGVINELHEEHAQIITLRYVHGHSVKDIARIVGKTENATSIIIHRSIKKIRDSISKHFGQL